MTKRYNRVMNVAMTKKQLLNCVDQMNSGLLITDENGVIKYFNNAYLQLTKLSGLEIGDNIMTYYHQGIIKSKPACIEAIHSENKIIRQFTQSEDGVFIISSSETIKSDDGKIAFVITRVHDMTDFFEVRDDIENVRRIMEKLAQNDVEMNSQYGKDIIAINADYRQLLERGEKVAIFDVPVLITGESGTGKDVMARFIHDHSHRKEKHLLRSIVRQSRIICLRQNCLDIQKGLLPVNQKKEKPDFLRQHVVVLFFWMRLVTCHWLCRQNYCVFWNPKRICKWVAAK